MSDSLNVIWEKFFDQRTKPLWDRFSGHFRACVVETNDPLRMHRIRIKCPDLHDYNLKPEECPWAVPSFDFGTKRQGRWAHPCIGDWVWVAFERNHPNAPIWVGMANPTRRKFYSLPSIYGTTPLPVDDQGHPTEPPNDFNQDYMPQDQRPMSHGWQDRYGNLDLQSSVGFFPVEQSKAPAPAGYDAIQSGAFQASQDAPVVNQPDVKHLSKVSKYGNISTLGDQGYWWQSGDGDYGEFTGDCDKDEQFEIQRWLYLQKLLNENQPASADKNGDPVPFGDQRRIEQKSRYGHKFEMRDVGWAQPGPIDSKSRAGEYGDPAHLSVEDTNDFRWMKLRTKGGMLFQAYDKGFDPQDDLFVKRKLIEECAHMTEREDLYWANKDARWMRMVTRWGIKFVLDDRGSDPKDAEGQENPKGNGALLKGRRTPKAANQQASGDPRGFYLEFNENDQLNHLTAGSPLGHTLELNDRFEYSMLASSLGKQYSRPWQKLKENEFLLTPAMNANPEVTAHHLKLDHENEYIRLKSRTGNGPAPDNVVNQPDATSPTNQGFEIRDGSQGDGAWVEAVDCDGRGLWMSHRQKLTSWRAKDNGFMFQFMDENQKVIAVVNGAPNDSATAIKLVCSGNIELFALQQINIMAANGINVLSTGADINMQAGGTQVTISASSPQILTNAKYMNFALNADFATAAGAACQAPLGSAPDQCSPYPMPPPTPATPATLPRIPQLEPTDRGRTYNGPFDAVDSKVVEHPIQ